MQRFKAAAQALATAGVAAGAILATCGPLLAREMAGVEPAESKAVPTVVASLDERLVEKSSSIASSGVLDSNPGVRPARARTIITGDASFYEEKGRTSSGERYDGKAFTAAAQILLRDQFGGIYYGRNYRPSYGVVEWGGKKAIVKFNDVGPLVPGRAFDFSRATMEYFGGIDLGVLPHVTVRLLPLGHEYPQGPVTDTQLAAIEAQIVPAEMADTDSGIMVASATDTSASQCGGNSLSLYPISLDTINARLVRTASLDNSIVGSDPEQRENQAELFEGALPNDLGQISPAQELP
ncbi:MAG TPA: septal ring lytic transglycosylase RlpA family protein [Pseudolabrys sp.]|jgi:rare lipoprotein A|nr:septal ring lytic transglycosylase RlpA family protein [Pseudolabrys sp.]